MTMDLNELADRVEALAGPDAEVDALIRCALFASAGAYVKQSPINGAWCIYEPGHGGRERSWEPRGLSQEQRLGSFTASIDAAMTLLDWAWLEEWGYIFELSRERSGQWVSRLDQLCDGGDTIISTSATPAIALTAAALRTKALGAVHTLEGGL